MALEVVREEFEPQHERLQFSPEQPAPRAEAKPIDIRILNAVSALIPVLSVRLMLFVAIIVSGALTYTILPTPSSASLWALAIYNASVILPLIWLASRRG